MRSLLCCLKEHKKRLRAKGVEQIEEEKLEKYSQRYYEILEEGYTGNKKIKSKYLRQEEQRLLNRMKKYKKTICYFFMTLACPLIITYQKEI